MIKNAFIFPGQGSQKIGMGKELANNFIIAREVFEEVNDSLGQNLSELMFNDNDNQLILTENAQPAIMAVSIAILRILESNGIDIIKNIQFVTGHSLGEYSALVAAGVISLYDAAKLLKIRGQLMQRSCSIGTGSMAAIIGLNFKTVIEVVKSASDNEVCQIANDNTNNQIVISGHKLAVKRALKIAKLKGAKYTTILSVSAPFHCSLMQPAANIMKEKLADINMNTPTIPFINNISAHVVLNVEDIRKQLVKQITNTVRWRESILFMIKNNINQLIEIGNGRVLTKMLKRIDSNLSFLSCSTIKEIDILIKLFN